jgi:hypothetical protein
VSSSFSFFRLNCLDLRVPNLSYVCRLSQHSYPDHPNTIVLRISPLFMAKPRWSTQTFCEISLIYGTYFASFTERRCWLHHHARWPSLVGCSRLHIQRTRKYSQCLQASFFQGLHRTGHSVITRNPLNMVYLLCSPLRCNITVYMYSDFGMYGTLDTTEVHYFLLFFCFFLQRYWLHTTT